NTRETVNTTMATASIFFISDSLLGGLEPHTRLSLRKGVPNRTIRRVAEEVAPTHQDPPPHGFVDAMHPECDCLWSPREHAEDPLAQFCRQPSPGCRCYAHRFPGQMNVQLRFPQSLPFLGPQSQRKIGFNALLRTCSFGYRIPCAVVEKAISGGPRG